MNRKLKQLGKYKDKILTAWEASIAPALAEKLACLDTRRSFLTGLLRSTAVVSSLPFLGALQGCDRPAEQQRLLLQDPWQTFAAVQQQLLPTDGNGPSASDINASVYLKFVLDAPDTDIDDKTFVLNGIKWLNGLSDEQFGQPFKALNPAEQHKALEKIASSSAGERWLSHLLLYIMEALLTDPVYGGNPDGIGWQWLEHQPGFPQPTKDKRYTALL